MRKWKNVINLSLKKKSLTLKNTTKLGMKLFGLLPTEEASSAIKVLGVLLATTSQQFFLNNLRYGIIDGQFFY